MYESHPPRRQGRQRRVHGKPVTLHLEQLWIRSIAITTTGLVDTYSTPTLLRRSVHGGVLAWSDVRPL
ncbi:hypothetical protein [Kribbella steppae]|uniref:hypothetical protein n=1 Tax=Kribbella steppae TaxID=2512223 RepID=UPI001A7E30FE|nr:hypothetical protein [Kribbella steppae]